MDAWLAATVERLAADAGIPEARLDLEPHDLTAILDLARRAAHESGDRTNAPVLCYLLGFAAGSSGSDLHQLIAALQS